MNRAIDEMNPDLCSDIEVYFEGVGDEEFAVMMSDEINFEREVCIEEVEMMQELLVDE